MMEEEECRGCKRKFPSNSLLRHIGKAKRCKIVYGEEFEELKKAKRSATVKKYNKANEKTIAARQSKYIKHLENAKQRIINKVYGICRETGKLISRDRLMAVPHATLSIEAKKSH